VISEKTGYPLSTLNADMDLDSDLGIDSIKRVEIMAALEGRLFTSLAGVNFEKFAELRTISQIAGYLASAEKKTLK
jgi:acyl carrier protein